MSAMLVKLMALGRLLLIPAAVLTLMPFPLAQITKLVPAPKTPQLTLEIIPLKKTYFVGETVFVKYKLTSLADGTVCFPPPVQEAQVSVTGYLLTDANLSTSEEKHKLIKVYDVRPPTDEQLRSDIANKWIKLGMSGPYRPKRAGKVAVLTEPGQWVLRSVYHPPELAAGQKAIVESLGCTPANVPVDSSPVTISVVDTPK